VQDNSFSKVDERSNTYKYYNYYNEKTDQIEKEALEVQKLRKFGISITKFVFLVIVIYSMIYYQILILTTKGVVDLDSGEVLEAPTKEMTYTGFFYTFVYSLVVIIFGTLYKNLANIQTDDENHRYQKNHDDALIFRLFLFNSLNFYIPLLFVAFDYRNPGNYDDLF